jgi:hypothetical protein
VSTLRPTLLFLFAALAPPALISARAAAIEAAPQFHDPATHEECRTRLTIFISKMDELLDSNPPSLDPLLDLLQVYFPLKDCDIESAIAICRQSKYFASVNEQPTRYVISFTSARRWSPSFIGRGFNVSFGVSKVLGHSEYPFAQVHK